MDLDLTYHLALQEKKILKMKANHTDYLSLKKNEEEELKKEGIGIINFPKQENHIKQEN